MVCKYLLGYWRDFRTTESFSGTIAKRMFCHLLYALCIESIRVFRAKLGTWKFLFYKPIERLSAICSAQYHLNNFHRFTGKISNGRKLLNHNKAILSPMKKRYTVVRTTPLPLPPPQTVGRSTRLIQQTISNNDKC